MSAESPADLRFAGDAWGWTCSLGAIAACAPADSRAGRTARALVAAWRNEPSTDVARALVLAAIDGLLCEHMPETSTYAELEQGPWQAVSAGDALAVAEDLVRTKGCDAGRTALAAFRAAAGEAVAAFSLRHPSDIAAAAVVTAEGVWLFFEAQ